MFYVLYLSVQLHYNTPNVLCSIPRFWTEVFSFTTSHLMFRTKVFHILCSGQRCSISYVLDRGVPYLCPGQRCSIPRFWTKCSAPHLINVLYRGVPYLTFWTEVFYILCSGQRCSIPYALKKSVQLDYSILLYVLQIYVPLSFGHSCLTPGQRLTLCFGQRVEGGHQVQNCLLNPSCHGFTLLLG